MLKSVKIFSNAMVMSFDEKGEQMTDLQGTLADIGHKILDQLTPETRIQFAEWASGSYIYVDHEAFRRLVVPTGPAQEIEALDAEMGRLAKRLYDLVAPTKPELNEAIEMFRDYRHGELVEEHLGNQWIAAMEVVEYRRMVAEETEGGS